MTGATFVAAIVVHRPRPAARGRARDAEGRAMTAVYFYVCDDCGDLADIGERHAPEAQWVCAKCGSAALSEFADQDEATVYATRIMRSRFAAKMAALDQAKARLAEEETA